MAKKTGINEINVKLEEQLLIQVDGIEQKSHSISWEMLKNLCDSVQSLIEKLVRYSVDESPIDSKSIKLVFTGFYEGSAIPALKLEPRDTLFPFDNAIESLNNDFTDILKNLNKGDFESIAQKYTVPKERNEIIEAVFNFTNATNGAPINIVERNNDQKTFKKLAKVISMRKEQKKALILPIYEEEDRISIKEEEVGIIIKSVSKKGKKSTRVKKTFKRNEASLVYIFDSIEFESQIFIFNYPIYFEFSIIEKKNIYTIENKSLDIYAYGNTEDEVRDDLFYQFATTFNRLKEIDDNKLGEHLKKVKSQYNLIIHSVKKL